MNLPFAITSLGKPHVILGRKWLSWIDIHLDVRNRKLLWPPTYPKTQHFDRLIYITFPVPNRPLFDWKAQEDADRRDRALESRVYAILAKPAAPPNTLTVPLDQGSSEPSPKVDIAHISAPAFAMNLKRKDYEVFTTTLDELDHLIQDKMDQDRCLTGAVIGSIDYASDEALVEERLQQFLKYAPFKDVFSKRASDEMPPHRGPTDHKIELTEPNNLGHTPLWRQTTDELLAIKQYLVDNLAKGFIVPSKAPFASPVLFVKKPDGSLRFCVDYRRLNLISKRDQHPLPLIDETLARISGAKIFTKLDIRQAFYRIRMHPDSEELTTFRTRYGTYKYKILPFGLSSGPATYQRYMNEVLFDYLDDFCTAYLDDILIYSDNVLEHEIHVSKVLARLREAGLQVDIKKTEFHVTRTKFLGFIISTSGLEVDPDKIATITQWEYPDSVRGIQSFLGFCNFYRRFIKDYSRVAAPLNRLTGKGVPFKFDRDCAAAFKELQQLLTTAPILCHYQPSLKTQVETDASDGVIAGIMSQEHPNGNWMPVGYFSKTMSPAELNYQIHDKEMLAIVKSFQQWRADLASTKNEIRVWTDHKALEYFMTTKQLNQRQARWAEILSEFYFKICYRPGKQNEKADTLTRRGYETEAQDHAKHANRTQILLPADKLDPQIVKDLDRWSREGPLIAPIEVLDSLALIDNILRQNKNSATLDDSRKAAERGDQAWTLNNGLLLYDSRLIVPNVDNLRTQLIQEIHDQVSSAHPGKSKTISVISRQFYWKGLRSDVERYITNCHACRRASVPRDKTPGFLHPLPIPQRPGQHLTMDLKSFPMDKHGFDTLFVVMDRLSKQAWSIPCYKTFTARSLAELFLKHIWCREGFPDTIVSDRGPQFVSSFWDEICKILGIKIKLSTAFHPQTDGQTEIMNQYIDQRLRPFVNYYQDNWSELIPMMDYAQLTLPHESIHMSPFELLKGYSPRSTWDWHRPDSRLSPTEQLNRDDAEKMAKRMHDAWEVAKGFVKKSQEKKERDVNQHRREVDWDVDNKVWVSTKNWKRDRPSKKLSEQMAGPYTVLAKEGHSWRIDLPSSMKIHPVFPSSSLRKAADSPLPGQTIEPEPPINITGEEEWEIQEILAVRKKWQTLEYRVQWLGHDIDPEWYPASDFKYGPHKLRDFHLNHQDLPGPPRALGAWIKAWENGKDNYDDLDDDREALQSSRASFFQKGGIM